MSVEQCPLVILTAGIYNPQLMQTCCSWVTSGSHNSNDKIENNDGAVTMIYLVWCMEHSTCYKAMTSCWLCCGVRCSTFTRGQFWPSRTVVGFAYCRWLRLSVCMSARPFVCVCGNHVLVRAITYHPFKLGSPHLELRCKRPWLRSLMFCGVADLALHDQI